MFRVTHIQRVDIVDLKHVRTPRASCTLPHTKETYDRLAHVVQEYPEFFGDDVDAVVIERQPPGGMQDVQLFFYGLCRDKAVVVCPKSLHKFFDMQGGYEMRKAQSVVLGQQILDLGCDVHVKDAFDALGRAHDASDAMLLCYYHWHSHLRRAKERVMREKKRSIDDLDAFAYKPTENA